MTAECAHTPAPGTEALDEQDQPMVFGATDETEPADSLDAPEAPGTSADISPDAEEKPPLLSAIAESLDEEVQPDEVLQPEATPQETEPRSPLDNILSLQGFVDTADGRRFFPTTDSLRWFLRTNYRALAHAGAIVRMGRRTLIVRPQFDQAMIDILQTQARASLAD